MKFRRAKRSLTNFRTASRRTSEYIGNTIDRNTRPDPRQITTPLAWWYSTKKTTHYLCLPKYKTLWSDNVPVIMADGRRAYAHTKCLLSTVGYPTSEQTTQISRAFRAASQRVKLLRLRKK